MNNNGAGPKAITVAIALLFLGSYLVFEAPRAEASVTVITWSTNQPPLTSDYVVPADYELVIMAGVIVPINPGINITVYGNITILGTPINLVRIGPNIPGSGWGSLQIINSARPSHISNCLLIFADYGIYSTGSEITVDHTNITQSNNSGIYATNSKINITNSELSFNGPYSPPTPTTDSAIYLNHTSGRIDNNTLLENHNGLFMKFGSSVTVTNNTIIDSSSSLSVGILIRSGSIPTIEHNTIAGNTDGIVCNASSALIRNNTVSNNARNGILLVQEDSSYLADNDISFNGDEGVDMNNGSTPQLVHNSIKANVDKGVLIYSANPTLSDNSISGNNVGMMVTSSGIASTYRNHIFDNTNYGIVIDPGCGFISNFDIVERNSKVGLEVNSTSVQISNITLKDHEKQVRALNHSYVYLINGSSTNSTVASFEIIDSNITTLNFTRDTMPVMWAGLNSTLLVSWYLNAKIIDQYGQPTAGVPVNMTPTGGRPPETKTTDSNGRVNWWILRSHITWWDGTMILSNGYSPYELKVANSKYSNWTSVGLNQSRWVTMTLFRSIPPVLTVPFGAYSFLEDTDAPGLVNCSEHFSHDGPMMFQVIFQEDSTKILAQVNGNKLDLYTPTQDWFGYKGFKVRAIDGEGLYSDGNFFNITVVNVNDPPTLAPLGPFNALVGQTVTGTLKGSDIDNAPGELVYKSLSPTPAEVTLTLDPITGAISFVSTGEGYFQFWFFVCDPNLACSGNISVNFTVTGLNTPPAFTNEPPTTVYLGNIYRYTAQYYDPDSDTVTLTLGIGPPSMNLSGLLVEWTPNSTELGQHPVMLKLSDGVNLPVPKFYNITVLPKNQPPTAKILSPANGAQFKENATISFNGNATDPNGDALSYTWKIDGALMSKDLFFNTPLAPGTHAVSFGVSDGIITVYHNISIIVKSDHQPPPVKPYKTHVDYFCLWLMITIVLVCIVSVTIYHKLRP